MFQTKEQDKTPEVELCKVKTNNIPNKGFKVMIIKMLNELRRRMNDHSEKFNKELENIKKNQTELMRTITEIKNTLEGINSRLYDTEEWIIELEDKVVEITEAEQKKEFKKNEDSLKHLQYNKHTNNRLIEVPDGEEREKGAEYLLEVIMAENFPILGKETDIQVYGAQSPK